MAFNGSGVFVRLYNWVNDRNNGIDILASRMDGEMDGFATGLTDCVTKDGQSTPTNDIPFGGFRLKNVGNATASTDAVTAAQIQSNGLTYYADTGAADVYVITPAPVLSAYVAGQSWKVKIANTNLTITPTLNVNSLGAKNIKASNGSSSIAIGDLVVGAVVTFIYDGTNMQMAGIPTGIVPITRGGFGRSTIGTANQIPQVNGTADGFVYTYAMNQGLQTVDSPTFVTLTTTQSNAGKVLVNNASGTCNTGDVNITGNFRTNGTILSAGTAAMTAMTITGAGTWTAPSDTTSATVFKFTVTGGGGGGGGAAAGNVGAVGGGAGATAIYVVSGLTANTAYTTAVGAAGAAGSATPGAGGTGGNSSIILGATTVTGAGGTGGTAAGGSSVIGVAGGTATNGTINISGGCSSGTPQNSTNSGGSEGGSSYWGGGGGGGKSGSGGDAALAYGSGGGGAGGAAGATGGIGRQGVIIIERLSG